MSTGKVVVAGASGVIGSAAVRHFSQVGWDVVAVSRRAPHDLAGSAFASVDLTDASACQRAFGGLRDVTHLVYAALFELPGLVRGWTDRGQMDTNLRMLCNIVDPLLAASPGLQHVSLLQGTKAYGAHVAQVPIPCREDAPRHPHDNFYFLQEDALRDRQRGRDWGLTILRPQVVFGDSIGSPMNLIPVIGVYGALLREQGLPLSFPGGAPQVSEAVDADLLARVLEWAASSPAARDQIFNVTNGDVFVWPSVWPAIADALGMVVGDDRPVRLADELPRRADVWATIVDRHSLRAPRAIADFVGQSPIYADLLFRVDARPASLPTLVSTIKLRRAGFADCVDTQEMFPRLLRRMQEQRLLPVVNP